MVVAKKFCASYLKGQNCKRCYEENLTYSSAYLKSKPETYTEKLIKTYFHKSF